MINSPLNYTGNKFKLLNQIMPYLNNQSNKFVDVFAGSGLVGLNSDCQEIILNDNNNITVELLKYFKENTADNIIETMDKIIKKYQFTDTYRNGNKFYIEEKHEGLSRYNKDAFNKLKEDYNNTPSIEKLFALTIYGFNHYIRFNANGKYNVPVGKVDYSISLREKTKEYTEAFRKKQIKILNYDFRDKELYKDTEAIYYFDPPYLITDAPYNTKWSEEDEKELLELLDHLNQRKIKFALSNVLESNGKENKLLKKWCKKYNVFNMDRKYLNSNYRKKNITVAKEVLITNYRNGGDNIMSRSGNTPGYKVFSINTTVRNPQRNIEFLKIMEKYDGIELNNKIKEEIYIELIRYGVYQVTIKSEAVKEKYKDKIILDDDEIITLIKDNPQKTKNTGRVMTQVRALKDQGLVSLSGNKFRPLFKITELGRSLLENKNIEDIYSKAMIGLHANNPQRTAMYNRSRPFLNTLFVLNEIEKYCRENKKEYKGILYHEFGAFVLSMKDCNYKAVAKKIIEYRELFGKSINQEYIENYLYNELKLIDVKFEDIIKEYPDDVRRKFEMTSIMEIHGFSTYTYLRINEFNRTKANSIIEKYKDYYFHEFETIDDYLKYLFNIELPWLTSKELKIKIVNEKQKELNIQINENKTLDERIEELDKIYNNNIFKRFVEEINLETIVKEVLIIGKHIKQKSKFEGISPSLRLEWLVAVLTAKIYGSQYVNPNMSLNPNGTPKYYAKGGKADIEFETEDIFYILETTTICNAVQQLNSETTSVADHLKSISTKKERAAILIAPVIHKRTISFYKYCCNVEKEKMIPITIDKYTDLIMNNKDEKELIKNVNKIVEELKGNKDEEFFDIINSYRSQYIQNEEDEINEESVVKKTENNKQITLF